MTKPPSLDLEVAVAFLPRTVVMVSPYGNQFFSNPYDVPEEKLPDLFPTRGSLEEAATLHKEGVTDKDLFVECVSHLKETGQLSGTGLRELVAFIDKCDCPPKTIEAKLQNMGYGWLLPKIRYSRNLPELDVTVDIMWKYIRKLRAEEDQELKGRVNEISTDSY